MRWAKNTLTFVITLTIILQISTLFDIHSEVIIDLEFTGQVEAKFYSGNGSESNPYQISNIDELQDIRSDLGANYSIINDIDASETKNWNDGKGFEPIGNPDYPFRGALNGNGYKIENLFIQREETSYVGLLGCAEDAFLSNISLINVEIIGEHRVAGLVGSTNYTYIVNCSSTGYVEGIYNRIGGLVGSLKGYVINSYSTSIVKGHAFIGGLIGVNIEGDIINCYSKGDVIGYKYAGGLLGFHQLGNINDSYSIGNIEGDQIVGGFVGQTQGHIYNCYSNGNISGEFTTGGFSGALLIGNITNCYSIGNVFCQSGGGFSDYIGHNGYCSNSYNQCNLICEYNKGEEIYLGGFANQIRIGRVEKCYTSGDISYYGVIDEDVHINGFNCYSTSGSVIDCFWDSEISGIEYSIKGIQKNTSQMMKKKTFTDANWDFEGPWAIHEGFSYPFLRDQYHPPIIISNIADALEDQHYSFQMNSDISYIPGFNNTPEYYMITNANWLNLTSDGILSGTPTNDHVGTYWARITVVDQADNIDRKEFTFKVLNANDDPIIVTDSLPPAVEDVAYHVPLIGIDIDPTRDSLSWEMEKNNASFLFLEKSTGILSGTPSENFVGTYSIEISLKDGNGGVNSTTYELTVLDVNDLPIIISEDMTTINQDELYKITYKAFDEDDPDDFIWHLHSDAGWLTMMNETGELLGIPGNNDTGEYFVNITVEDARGGRSYRNFSLEVIDVNDPPIWVNVSEDVEVQRGELFTFEFEAMDIDDPEVFDWSLNSNADWLRLISGTGKLTGIPKENDVGIFFANVMVEDARGGRSSYNFTLTVKNENDPPVWSEIPVDEVVDEDTQYTFDVNAFDMDEDPLIYGISSNPETDISIDEETGVITWTATLDDFTPPLNVLYVSLTVSDGYHLIYRNFTISVVRNSTTQQPVETGSNSSDVNDDSSINPILVLMSVLLIIIIIVAILLLVLVRRKYGKSAQKISKSSTKPASMIPGTDGKIFISYAKDDGDTAFKICQILEDSGSNCWIAPRDITPGETWGSAIIDGINSCRLMIMVFSENSNQSVQVLREIERAVHKKIPIIIFRISEIEPSKEFEYYVSAVHWLDAVSEPKDKHIENLKDVVMRTSTVKTDDKKVLDQKIQNGLNLPNEVDALPPFKDEVK
jgi:hypothetical protein